MNSSSYNLAIIIPSYNEERHLNSLLKSLLGVVKSLEKMDCMTEIIFVDDGSTDKTKEIVQKFNINYLYQNNQGKGNAVKSGIAKSQSDYVIILDADGEYDPSDIISLYKASQAYPQHAIYGSRYSLNKSRIGLRLKPYQNQSILNLFFNHFLSLLNLIRSGLWINDLLTGYKLYPTKVYKSLKIETAGFETDHEITRKLLKKGVKIIEVPISYNARTRNQGKKIGWRDALKAIKVFLK